MSEAAKIDFSALTLPKGGALVVFVGADLKPGAETATLLGATTETIAAAAETMGFKGKSMTSLDILSPAGLPVARLLVIGVAPGKDGKPIDFATLGGFVAGKLGKAKAATALFESPAEPWESSLAAEFGFGARLRS